MSEPTISGTALRIEGVGDYEPEAELLLIYRGWPETVSQEQRAMVERAYIAKYEGEALALGRAWGCLVAARDHADEEVQASAQRQGRLLRLKRAFRQRTLSPSSRNSCPA